MSTAGNAGQQAASDLRSKVSDVAENVKELGSIAKTAVQEKLSDVTGVAGDYVQAGRDRVSQMEQSMEGYIRDQPVKAVLIAAGVGFLLGGCLLRR